MNKRVIVICSTVLLLLMIAEYVYSDDFSNVANYIRQDRQGMKSEKTEKLVKTLTPIIVMETKKVNLDPLLVVVIMGTESSYNHRAIGKAGEVGLLQVKPRWFKKAGIKIVTIKDQIRVGVKLLANCIDACGGDILGGLTLYHMGSQGGCSKSSARARYKFRLYQKAKKEI